MLKKIKNFLLKKEIEEFQRKENILKSKVDRLQIKNQNLIIEHDNFREMMHSEIINKTELRIAKDNLKDFAAENKKLKATIEEQKEIIGSSQSEREKRVQRINTQLNRQLKTYENKATTDVRKGIILSDNQRATEIKFRRLKIGYQSLKKLNAQASLALKYVAQNAGNNSFATDLIDISNLLEPSAEQDGRWSNFLAADMVEQTQEFKKLQELSQGVRHDENPY